MEWPLTIRRLCAQSRASNTLCIILCSRGGLLSHTRGELCWLLRCFLWVNLKKCRVRSLESHWCIFRLHHCMCREKVLLRRKTSKITRDCWLGVDRIACSIVGEGVLCTSVRISKFLWWGRQVCGRL